MKLTAFCLFVGLILEGCYERKKIEITNEYVVNPNWDERGNAIEVCRLRVKADSIIDPFSDLNQIEILNKLEDDSSFIFFANVKYNQEKYSTRKVFFNKDNGFLWLTDRWGSVRVKTIGNLQTGHWYTFSNLAPYIIYVYIDSINKTHRFDVNLANY